MTVNRFVLCADDYGLASGVSGAILELASMGRLTAIGCMTNFAHWPLHAAKLSSVIESADIGLHLNLTLGSPLGSMKSLAPNGSFPSAAILVRRALAGQLDLVEIEGEIDRQCQAFEASLQQIPDFIDGHQHAHALPIVRKALIAVINKRYSEQKPWLRDPSDKVFNILGRGVATQKALSIRMLAAGFAKLAAKSGIRTNIGFSGFSPFDASRDYGQDFSRFLANPGKRHLIMCHPGFIDDELLRLDPVVDTRQQEFNFFNSERFSDICNQKEIFLSKF